MKKLVLFCLLLVMGSAVMASTSLDPGKTTGMAIVKNGATFKVYYKGTRKTSVTLSIVDEKNDVIYKETLKDVDGFTRPYNFSKLAEGEYTIELNGENGREVEKISYRKGKITKLAHLMRIPGEEEKFLLTVSNKGGEPFTVRIFDTNGNLLYSNKEKVCGDFAQVYNLQELNGKFILKLVYGNGFTQTLNYLPLIK